MLNDIPPAKGIFQPFIIGLAGAIALHLLAIYFHIGMPFVLLYGPLLYMAQRTFYRRRFSYIFLFVHLLPFLAFSIWYIASLPHIPFSYYQAYFIGMVLSLLTYAIIIGKSKQKWGSAREAWSGLLVLQLTTISCIVALLIAVLLVVHWGQSLLLDTETAFVIWVLTALSLFLILRYIYPGAQNKAAVALRRQQANLQVPLAQLQEYAQRIEADMAQKSLFLNADLSMDGLARETGIPKHHLSLVLSTCIGKNFYEWLAEYRIQHAVDRIQREKYIVKIESLAYTCGFNSKTSFNKYFKQFTGMTPSQFREKQEKTA